MTIILLLLYGWEHERTGPDGKLPDDSCKEDIKKEGIRETGQ